MNKNLIFKISTAIIFILLMIPIYLNLGKENVNVDQFLWYQRTSVFRQAFLNKNFSETYQQYHPGVFFMYLILAGQKVYEISTHNTSIYTKIPFSNFALYNFYTKFFVTSMCVLISFLCGFLLFKITKCKIIGFTFLILLFTEPVYIGFMRNLHMDVLVASLICVSILSFYFGILSGKLRYFVISGVFCGLGLLTKSIAITAIGMNFSLGLYFIIFKKDRKLLKRIITFFVVSLLIFFTFFPAMWVSPIQTINKIFVNGILKTAVQGEDNFSHVVRGLIVTPGNDFYLKIIKYRLSPIIQFCLLFFIPVLGFLIYKKRLAHEKILLLIISVSFTVCYLIIFSILQKKTDRYIFPIMPFIFIISSMFINSIYEILKIKKIYFFGYFIILLFFSYNLWTIYRIHPYYMAYYNPIRGGVNKAKKQIYINQGGIGAYELATYLNSKDISPGDLIGATNFEELQVFSKNPIHGFDPSKRKLYKYAVLTLQKDDDYKHGLKQVYSIDVLGTTYLRIYER